MSERKLTFGKFKGYTIADLMEEGEYGYIIWLYDMTDSDIVTEAEYEEALFERGW